MSGLTIGVDIGGTKIAAGVVDSAGQVLARQVSHAHAGQPPERVIAAVQDLVQRIAAQVGAGSADLKAVGVGFPGHTHGAVGRVLMSSNLPGWDDYPLRDRLQEMLKLPVVLDNDSNCAAWSEYRFGAGRGSRYMCYVTFSTGFGMGIILDGKIYAGATGTAGEIGHTVVDPDGPACSCGKQGCVMSYASGIAISRMACERVRSGRPTLLHTPGAPLPTHIGGEAVARAAQQGDPVAREVLAIAGRYFGLGLVTVVQVLNPDRIVIGGGLARIGSFLMDPCLQALRDYVHPVMLSATQVALAELGEDAGLVGAADLAWGYADSGDEEKAWN